MSAPRLLVPGVLDVVVLDGGAGWIERGPLCDVAASVPQQEDLGRVALVPVQALPRPVWAALDLVLHPHVQAQLERLRWALVELEVAETLHAQGHPILEVEGGVAGARWRPADGPARRYIAPDPVLWSLLLGDDPDPDVVERWAETGCLQDRIVMALTGDAVGLRDLELARWAAGLTPASLDHEEAVLIEIAERGETQREQALALLAALDHARVDAAEVPLYGTAERVVDAGFTLTNGGGVSLDGGELHVPAAVGWTVQGVEPWEPDASLGRRIATFEDWHARIQDTRQRTRRKELMVWGLIGLLLVIGLAVGLLGQLALSRVGGPPDEAPMDTVPGSPER